MLDYKKWIHRLRSSWHWVVGPMAILWILIRSATDPRRLSYPCQTAAMPVAMYWILAIVSLFTGSLFLRRFAKVSGIAILAIGAVWLVVSTPSLLRSSENVIIEMPVWKVPDPVSNVYILDTIPATSGSLAAGDASVPDEYLSDPAIDTILLMLETHGTYLHRTTEHPDGVAGADNVVIIKGNFQWTSRNTTSTDRVKGLIWRILQHPAGFTGEIIVCDNTQNQGTRVADNDNNSEDEEQSIIDVVNTFYAKGYPVYVLNWCDIWSVVADEYSAGDYSDGYIYETDTRISYPKFRTPSGDHYVSLKYGVWDSLTAEYDSSRLCVVDIPVPKAHAMAGATIAVKNWIGVLTTAYPDQRYGGWQNMHFTYFWGPYSLVARVMEVVWPRLVIVDGAWMTGSNANVLASLVNTRMLLASTDPVAVSWYVAKYALIEVADYTHWVDPDGNMYGRTLRTWQTYLADSAGLACTLDSTRMSIWDRDMLSCDDSDRDGTCDLADNCPGVFNADQMDTDGDGLGDNCDECTDTDGDGYGDPGFPVNTCDEDNCPTVYSLDLTDSDGDGVGDVCEDITLQQRVNLAEVARLFEDSILPAGQSNAFTLKFTNLNSGNDYSFGAGFRIYSPDGATWTTADGSWLNDFDDQFTLVSIKRYGVTGQDVDTLGFTGVAMLPDVGLFDGWDTLSVELTIGPTSIDDMGRHICIDSCWFPSSMSWQWVGVNSTGTEYPDWSGEACFVLGECCVGRTGNVDGDPADLVDIADLTTLIDFLFISYQEPACLRECNVDGDTEGLVDIGDLTRLIDFLFITYEEPAGCL
ncbi:MAG: DUF362 domain-containing protein [Candidatus Zixiibacteriota bacterium]|nr:MAG: DUF362 domain-containing protein [candidate division Zixibacteria bacterium]